MNNQRDKSKLSFGRPIPEDMKDSFGNFEYTWNSKGLTPDKELVTIKSQLDALTVPEAMEFLPQVINRQIVEAVEPILIGEALLTHIQYQPGQTIHLPVEGAYDDTFDLAEGEEYPEFRIQLGGGTVIQGTGKSGLAMKFTEEVLRYSSGYDVVGLHTRAASRALARFKERKIFTYLASVGIVTHDNDNPNNSIFGITQGRDLLAAANGSIIADDIFDAYSALLYNGFTPNLIMVHPLTWLMFVKDPVLRMFALNNGGGTFFATWNGDPAQKEPWPSQSGGLGMSPGRNITPSNANVGTPSGVGAYSQKMNSSPSFPDYFFAPFSMIVSPFMPFNPATQAADIIMADRNELGFFIDDEPLQTLRHNEFYSDLLYIKMRERYDLAVKNEGQGVAVLRGIRVVPNQIILPAQTTIGVNATIGQLNRTTAV